MSADVVSLLIDTGILQFGQFKVAPYRLCAEYLPAFPEVLTAIAERTLSHLVDLVVSP